MSDENNGKEEMMDQNSQNDEQNYSQDFQQSASGNGDGTSSANNANNGDSQDEGNFNANGNGNGNQEEGVANQENNENGNDENGNGTGNGNDHGNDQGNDQGNDAANTSMEPEQFRKVFIGGLSYKTDDDALKAYFSKYGELVDHVVMKDSQTGRSRGFGFVTYSNSSMVDELMKSRPHIIDGRQVEPKRATPREVSLNHAREMLVCLFLIAYKFLIDVSRQRTPANRRFK